jgi:hypothetical protein
VTLWSDVAEMVVAVSLRREIDVVEAETGNSADVAERR